MNPAFPLVPERASSLAGEVDALFLFILGVTGLFAVGVWVALLFFAVRYRRRKADDRPPEIEGSLVLELTWTIIPLVIMIVMFAWGAKVFFHMNRPPDDAMTVSVVGKRWMWKLQQPTGQREINELHVPRGRAVRLLITSEDTIHSFFVPAFRIKKDAVPGRYNTAWFRATRTGTYHLFCAEYCGTEHARMTGRVVVMEPEDYENWLAGGPPPESPVAAGERLFTELNCVTCHRPDSAGRGPVLVGLFGRPVKLASGETVVADEAYVRESIVTPSARVVAGYQPVMPTFQGQVSEDQLIALIAYIRSLQVPAPGASAPAGGERRQ
ncbi:MAG TPA: cytochrome c oxidase subunit II [Vicinamibacteria bacterium]|nr:cytochrome c oxidase subunit II [Vicinamibacteria bacterium]